MGTNKYMFYFAIYKQWEKLDDIVEIKNLGCSLCNPFPDYNLLIEILHKCALSFNMEGHALALGDHTQLNVFAINCYSHEKYQQKRSVTLS